MFTRSSFFLSTTVALFLLLAAFRLAAALLNKGLGSEDEVRLVQYLFESQGYNPLIRPVRNLTEKIEVKFGLAMIQLINVDEKNQIMKSNVWLRMQWHDYQLAWDPGDYGGIRTIRILPYKVWKPDIVLFNNADGKYEVSYKPNVVIFHTGGVLWIPPAIYKSSCTIDVQFFPFDQQTCDMKFGSWTFNGDQVSLSWYEGNEQVDLSDYVKSGTWDIIERPGKYEYKYDNSSKHYVAQITFTLKIRRKTLFYTVNLIIPCVLISFLSVCVFYLPADAGEKMTMCISILLALVVFLLLVSKILPPTSITIPLIAKYLLFTFIMNIVTIFITVIIINWNFRTPRTHRMHKFVRLIFLNWLPRVLLMKRPNHSQRWAKKTFGPLDMPRSTALADHVELNRMPAHLPACSSRHVEFSAAAAAAAAANAAAAAANEPATFAMTPETHRAIEAVRFIAAHLRNEDDYEEILEDWRYIAMVIDRLQFYIFLAVTVGGSIGILISAPHIFEFTDQDSVIRDTNDVDMSATQGGL